MEKSTHKVEVVPIKLEPHPNADSLSIVRVFGGYTVCVRTEDWKGVALGAYIPADSVCPNTPEFEFLGDHKIIRARKLRGIPSFGMLVPAPEGASPGDDVAEQLGITHYEPPEKCYTGGKAERPPKGYLPSFDVDTGKKYHSLFKEGEPVFVTQKIHGACSRFVWKDNRMYCGSKSEWKREDDKNLWWRCLKSTPSIEEFCKNNPDTALYGEVYGAVQDMAYNVPKGQVKFAAFDVLKNGVWLDSGEALELVKPYNVPWVPIVFKSMPFNLEKILELAEQDSLVEGDNPGSISEGVVVKPIKERVEDAIGRLCLKFVSLRYLTRK